ncbi:hypothetical protein Taro_046940 [Colocasia esculenta]|uniref:Uncharacterized protein n=1 Tax=Colocasia esculenta TaxID=4460 RepID=A0A843X6P4_COLES|nr:hypothetical protein [Colocasia esculenta]
MVCFISRARRALADGGLVRAVGVWRAVLLMEASVLRCGFSSCVWKRLVVCVSFLCFPLVAQGSDAPLWCMLSGCAEHYFHFVPDSVGFCGSRIIIVI